MLNVFDIFLVIAIASKITLIFAIDTVRKIFESICKRYSRNSTVYATQKMPILQYNRQWLLP